MNYAGTVLSNLLRVMALSYSEDPMIVGWVVLTQCQCVKWRTDRRTDRRTDGFTIANTALTRCKNMSKWNMGSYLPVLNLVIS